jgi:RNA polymerase sigma-70 factor (ECF subfamily)
MGNDAAVELNMPETPVARGTGMAEDPEASVNLLVKAQAGDAQALNDLLARHLPRLTRWASGRLPLGLRTMLDTGDIVQDAVINAIRNLPNLEIRSDHALESYLRRAIKNRIIDVYRRPRRDREEPQDNLPERGPSPFDLVIGAEALERYEAALDELKEQERHIIVMHVELGLTTREIAEEMEKSVDAARMALTRALARLAAEMQRNR